MTGKEIHDQITAFVDDRIDTEEYRQKVEQHIKYCPDCRAAFETELMARVVVRDNAQQLPVAASLPGASATADGNSTQTNSTSNGTHSQGEPADWIDRVGSTLLSPVAIALAVVLILGGAWVLYRAMADAPPEVVEDTRSTVGSSPTTLPAENLFNKAEKNFSAIEDGTLRLGEETDNPSDLERYFKENGVAYQVVLPSVHGPLAGGLITDHGSTRLAHILYRDGEKQIYILEVPLATLKEGKIVYVTDDTFRRLEQGEWIWEQPGPGRSLVLFKLGGVICAIVANVERPVAEQLLRAPHQ